MPAARKPSRSRPSTRASLELAKLEAEARAANATAEYHELRVSELRRTRDVDWSCNYDHREYRFIGAVGEKSVEDCISALSEWHRQDASDAAPYTIVFNSPGGSVLAGFALIDHILALQAEGRKFVTIARGMAASMGGILLQAGDERVIGENAYMLIHEVSTAIGGKMSDLEDEVKFAKRLADRGLEILAERSTLTKRQIANRWKRKDWWLDSAEVVNFGFADRIG